MRLILILVFSLAVSAAVADTVVFHNVNILPMTGETVLQDHALVASGGKIISIVPAADLDIPDGATIIDGLDGYLMPGLQDTHTHPDSVDNLLLYLARGVTTIWILNAPESRLGWRDTRDVLPSVVVFAGPISRLDDPEVARQRVRGFADSGFDGIKPYGNLTLEAMRALLDEADRQALLVSAHIPRNLAWRDVLPLGPGVIAHAEEFIYSGGLSRDPDIPTIVELMIANDVALTPTIYNYHRITEQIFDIASVLEDPALRYLAPIKLREIQAVRNRYAQNISRQDLPWFRHQLSLQSKLIDALNTAGGIILAGTDSGNGAVIPGDSLHSELEWLQKSGLTPYEALRSATVNPAKRSGDTAVTGTLEVGAQSDLVWVLGNPLEDIGNTRLVAGVLKGDHWQDSVMLDAKLEALASSYRDERTMAELADAESAAAAIAWARGRQATLSLRPSALNELGYQSWYWDDDPETAFRAFALNAELHPEEWWVYASLAEVALATGRTDVARGAFESGLRLNPGFREAADWLRENPKNGAD